MIDIGDKQITERIAIVEGKIILNKETLQQIKDNTIPKGNVLEAAKLAGIISAKKTADVIPHCHPIPIENVKIQIDIFKEYIKVRALVKSKAKTGVEMEGFMAVTGACLTIYDMCKFLDKAAKITDIALIKKSGGKSGAYQKNM